MERSALLGQPLKPYFRFRLRTVLVAVTLAAPLAATLGVLIRTAPPDAQDELLTLWISYLSVALLQIFPWWLYVKRHAIRSGVVRYRLRLPNRLTLRSLFNANNLFPWGCLLVSAWGIVILVVNTRLLMRLEFAELNESASYAFDGFMAGMMTFVAAGVAVYWFSSRQILTLCERGIIFLGDFVPWQEIKECWWDVGNPTWFVASTSTWACVAEAPMLLREEIKSFLAKRSQFVDYALPEPKGRGGHAGWLVK